MQYFVQSCFSSDSLPESASEISGYMEISKLVGRGILMRLPVISNGNQSERISDIYRLYYVRAHASCSNDCLGGQSCD